jgi:hypothetical protein
MKELTISITDEQEKFLKTFTEIQHEGAEINLIIYIGNRD